MDYLGLQATLRPFTPAVFDTTSGLKWTYAEFDRFVSSCAAQLMSDGVTPGKRVACLAKNRAEIIALHLACARLGAIFVPLNWRLSAAELNSLIADAEPSVIYGDALAEQFGIACNDIASFTQHNVSFFESTICQNDATLPSLILYTSGTTGKPKGVMLSEKNLAEVGINFGLLGDVDSASAFLCEAPMFHIIGLITSVRPALMRGARIVITDGFIPERTLACLYDPELGLTHYFCVPQMAAALRRAKNFDPKKLDCLKAIFTGGAPHPESQIRCWLDDGIAVVDGYGMSEAGTVFGMPLDKAIIEEKAGSVGVPTPRVEVRVVDEEEQLVTVDAVGELQIRGANVSIGYWKNELEYRKVLTDDGWFRTGDIVTVDSDGFYRIVDRKKDMFISGGENIYPAEVEQALLGLPDVREFAVVGVQSEQWGEMGCLFYVSSRSLAVEDIENFLSGKLAKFKIPKMTFPVEVIPRTGTGKVLKHELKKIFMKNNGVSR